jgi:hypothetical protein
MNGLCLWFAYSIRFVCIVLSYTQYIALKYIHTSCLYIYWAGHALGYVCRCIKILFLFSHLEQLHPHIFIVIIFRSIRSKYHI